jgi:hypothetical protein
MRKSTLLSIIAAGMLTADAVAQAPRFVLFEHFTQASCAPCASQNPGFQSSILNANPLNVRHIAYHTSWPGVDPMYSANPTESDDRVTYYGINGVPHVVMMGNHKRGAPGAFVQADVDAQYSMSSPIRIVVSEVDNGATRDVTVTVTSVGAPPAGSYTLRTAIVEDPIQYGTPPGNNGETDFPNVFRKMLPGSSGDAITLPSQGNSITFNYTYTEDAAWLMNNIKLIAFVQNNSTQEILNSGSTIDPPIMHGLSQPPVMVQGSTGAFNMTASNLGGASETFNLTLTSNAPGNWSSSFSVNSVNFTSTGTATIPANTDHPVVINVTPGSTPAVGEYTLVMQSTTNPTFPPITKKVYVISGVTDLIVNNSGWVGDGTTPGNASNWQADYIAGLTYAGNTAFATTNEMIAARGIQDGAFTGVNNIYFNVGWTFPSFTNELVTRFSSFLNGGGNLFISGQDIGWDTWDLTNGGNGTPATQSFYTTYLGANYANDGGTANTQLTTVTTDPVWGTMPNATITNYYGGTYFFPDELTVATNGAAIYKYNTSTTKVGGVRATNGTWKTVYLGAGIEMLSSAQQKNEILKLAHDWFYGFLSTEDFDKAMLMLGQNYPNPAEGVTYIPMSNIEEDMTLQVIDLMGRVVMSQEVAKGADLAVVNTSQLDNGMYMYRLMAGTKVTTAKPMQVIR